MVESSKILTVSYGTFSCTLEGFDDSFSTMKAIAEYFRDLAAGDRYFGAEPPTPDTEMLTRIAEREISRRVEARTSDAGIVLRASEPAPQSLDKPETAPAMPPAQQPPAEAAATAAARHPDSESVADKLKRIRSVVGTRADTSYAEDLDEGDKSEPVAPSVEAEKRAANEVTDPAPAVERDHAPTDAGEPVSTPEADPALEGDTDDDTDVQIKEVLRNLERAGLRPAAPLSKDAATPSVMEAGERVASQIAIDVDTDADTPIKAEKPVEAEAETPALEEAEPKAEETPRVKIAQVESPNAVPAKGVAPQADATKVQKPRAEEVKAGANDVHEDEAKQAAPAASELSDAKADAKAQKEADEAAAMIQSLIAQTREAEAGTKPVEEGTKPPKEAESAIEPSVEARQAEKKPADQVAAKAEPAADKAEPTNAAETAPKADAAEAPAAPRRGRILRVTRRPRPDAAVGSDAPVDGDTADAPKSGPVSTPVQDARARLAEMRREMRPAPQEISAADNEDEAEMPVESSLSQEDEADLQRDLAAAAIAAEAELTSDDDDDSADAFVDDAVDASAVDEMAEQSKSDVAEDELPKAQDAAPQPQRDTLPSASEAEMARINAQADQEQANPESSRRRDAIAHLKAAVAATEAARQLGEPRKSADSEEDDFREDLQKVVKPRRPVTDTPARTERPHAAPLKLVASQRVDTATEAAEKPVQPRRVAAPAAKDDDASDFAEYAQNVGANSLQDLLEAAAAYVAIVEGAEDFSRPQIMQKVQATATEDFSREDGLRSFGTLLRQGRIEKARAGRFQISDRTRFRPEPQAANG